jgi:hypothetical protein
MHLFSCKNPEFLNIIPSPAQLGQFFWILYLRGLSSWYRVCKLGLMFLASAVVSLKSKAAVSANLWRSRQQVG